MYRIVVAGLIGAQAMTTPARSAELVQERAFVEQQRAGSFAGARLRMSLGGGERDRLRAGFVMAPTMRGFLDGRAATRFSEGLELGVTRHRALALSIGGVRPARRGGRAPGVRAGVSTLGWIAIGTGVALVVGSALFLDAMRDASE